MEKLLAEMGFLFNLILQTVFIPKSLFRHKIVPLSTYALLAKKECDLLYKKDYIIKVFCEQNLVCSFVFNKESVNNMRLTL